MIVTDDRKAAVCLALIATLLFALQDAATKFLAAGFSPFQISMLRLWAIAVMTVVFALARGIPMRSMISRSPVLQMVRAGLLVADIWLFTFALRTQSLAEAQSIALIYPLLAMVAAAVILGERLDLFRIVMILVGLAGTLVIIRPGMLPLNLGTGCTFLAASCFAFYLVLTRYVSRTDSAETSMLYLGGFGSLATTAVGLFFWRSPDMVALAVMGCIMISSCGAHALMALALAKAPAGLLQPINYTSLCWSIALSFLIFGEMINTVSLIGAVMIVCAGTASVMRDALRPFG